MKKISFIIIAYNEEKAIANSIGSILDQNELNKFRYEIIVVNDGSKDDTGNIVKHLMMKTPEIKLVNLKKNKGRGYARYAGVKKSTGNYVAFVDADIILSPNWILRCLKSLKNAQAVGGIAVPDGDVMYVFRKLYLKPKAKKHTTELTGSNSMFKAEILKQIPINRKLIDGEDVDLTWREKKTGYKVKSIPNLFVLHQENKNFPQSIKWLYQSGKGANRLLIKHKKIRLPDIVVAVFYISIVISILLSFVFNQLYFSITPILFIIVVSFSHIYSKFVFTYKEIPKFLLAGLINSLLILAYFIGRGSVNLNEKN